MPLNNQWVKEEINREIWKYLDSSENTSTTHQNLGDAAKTIRRRKAIRINVSIKKKEKKKRLDILILFLKELEKEEQIKPRVGRRKKI